MSSVISGYSNYSVLTEEQRTAGRSFLERHRAQAGEMGQGKKTDADAVDFSARSRNLAASGSLSREEMEAFSYSHLLEFETEDGRSISVDLAMDPDSEERYLAARITVINADGSEEVLYVPFDTPPPPPPVAEDESEADAGEEGQAEALAVVQAAAEEAQPSLMDLIEKYGLNKTADASEGIFAAIKARIEAMIEAARETAEEDEAQAAVRAEREERNDASGEASDDAEIGQEVNQISGRVARSLAGYARVGAGFTTGMGSFSRRY